MHFETKLQSATLIRRYKRFLADIEHSDGALSTIHCANTGAMTGCAEPGNTVWYSTSSNKKRKYPHSWELSETKQGDKICVNTMRANQVAVEAVQAGVIKQLLGYSQLRTEVKYGSENSRIDLLLEANDRPPCYVEVKSVTLLSPDESELGRGYFPDTVTTRGQKHLRELTEMVASGHRAVLLFTILHSGIENVASAHHIDARYSLLLKQAIESGVEVLCYKAELSEYEIRLSKQIDFIDDRLK